MYLPVGGAADSNRQPVEKITEFYNFVDGFKGESFADKTADMVNSLGVVDCEIAAIKKIPSE